MWSLILPKEAQFKQFGAGHVRCSPFDSELDKFAVNAVKQARKYLLICSITPAIQYASVWSERPYCTDRKR